MTKAGDRGDQDAEDGARMPAMRPPMSTGRG
jgi:hypothetical protein